MQPEGQVGMVTQALWRLLFHQEAQKLDMELNGFCVMSDEGLVSSVVLFPHSFILEGESLFYAILYATF